MTSFTATSFRESQELEAHAALLSALGHPVRLQIVDGLLQEGCCVGSMVECLGLPQPLISRHLAILRKAEVVDVDPEGRFRRYRVVHPDAERVVRLLLGPAPVGSGQGERDE